MATYQSEKVSIAASASDVFNKLSNLENLGNLIGRVPETEIPADQRAMLEQLKVTKDSITFPGGPAGNITLCLTEASAPNLIRMEGEGTPVPMSLEMHIAPLTPDTCETFVQIDLQIPAMLKPMVSGPMQKMANQFAQMLRQMRFD